MSGFGEPASGTRPQMVTIAGWLLLVGGVLGALGSLSLLGIGGFLGGVIGSYAFLWGLISLALGAGEAWVGLQILRLTASGLRFGVLIAYASIAVSLLMAFAFGFGFGFNTLLGLLVPGFVLWVLNENKAIFTN